MPLNPQIYKRFPNLDKGLIWLYMTARQKGINRDIFPKEYTALEVVSMSYAFGITIPKGWMAKWVNKWPTASITMLDYAVSGNTKACQNRMLKFVKDFNSIMGTDYEVDVILDIIDQATDRYLDEQDAKYWQMTKKNAKFISDMNGSVLEEYCRQIIEQR